jgi:hypothetical protein
VANRVARWFVFKPKIQIWVNFGGSLNGRCWYILWTLGPFYGLLLYFMDIWYRLWKSGIFSPGLVFSAKKSGSPGGKKKIVGTNPNASGFYSFYFFTP